jgi:hypothetical protein
MKRTKFYCLMTAAVLLLALTSCNKKQAADVFKLVPPIPGLEAGFMEFEIEGNAGDNCFVNSKGKIIEGKVTVRYRQFMDAVDIYLAGITMEFQSAGINSTLQTTGMFEIRAVDGTEPLQVAGGKTIQVFIKTETPDVNYNFFKLNDNSGQWEFVDYPESQTSESSLTRALNHVKYKGGDSLDNYFIYNLDVLLDIMRQNYDVVKSKFKKYGVHAYNIPVREEIIWNNNYYLTCEMLWKDLDGKSFPGWLENSNWYDFWFREIEKRGSSESYQVLSHEQGNIYNLLFSMNGKKFTKRAEAIIPLKYFMQLNPDNWKNELEAKITGLKKGVKIDLLEESYRAFEVNSVGIYNCDRLLKTKDWYPLQASFVLGASNDTISKNLMMITADNTSCITIDPTAMIRFNANARASIFALLPGNEIAIFPDSIYDTQELKNLANEVNPKYTFILENAGKIENGVQLRKILGFTPKDK